MVYATDDDTLALSKESKYEYIQHDLGHIYIYIFKIDYYDNEGAPEENTSHYV